MPGRGRARRLGVGCLMGTRGWRWRAPSEGRTASTGTASPFGAILTLRQRRPRPRTNPDLPFATVAQAGRSGQVGPKARMPVNSRSGCRTDGDREGPTHAETTGTTRTGQPLVVGSGRRRHLVGAIASAAWLRYELQAGHVLTHSMLSLAILAALIHVLAGAVVGPYAVGHERASFEETRDVGRTVTITGLVLIGLIFQPDFLNVCRAASRSPPPPSRCWGCSRPGSSSARGALGARKPSPTSSRPSSSGPARPAAASPGACSATPTAASTRSPCSTTTAPRPACARGRPGPRHPHRPRAVADKYDANTLIIALPLAEASTIRELTGWQPTPASTS